MDVAVLNLEMLGLGLDLDEVLGLEEMEGISAGLDWVTVYSIGSMNKFV